MWVERNQEHPNYARMNYVYRQHHARYREYVKAHGLHCQDCDGRGEHGGDSMEPPEPCGWCESTGRVTRWMRGMWLTWRRSAEYKEMVASRLRAREALLAQLKQARERRAVQL